MKGEQVEIEQFRFETIDKDIPTKIVTNSEEISDEYSLIQNLKKEEMKLVETDSFVKICEPEGPVISRSGSKCVVALLDQWYIDYSIPEWKEKARECINEMELTKDNKQRLLDSVEWMNKWGFSRSFGL